MGRKSKKPKAYSYLRFSTPEQAAGDSKRRQTDLAARYAQEHGLELDDSSYADLGISAYRGKNAATGALRQFLEAVEDGIVPRGSFLLVENLDRLTRDHILAAQSLFSEILTAGVTIVTLIDGRSYSFESVTANPTDLIISLLTMMRAHDESALKGRRLREAWAAKRRKATEAPLTARAPGWLRLDKSQTPPRWEVIEERAEIVRRIFEMAARGVGQDGIAKALNEEGVPTFGRSKYWHKSYVHKILANAAVVGTFIPHTQTYNSAGVKVRTPEEPQLDYYPRVVDEELFNDVRAMQLDGRRQPSPKGRSRPAHMLAGLALCGLCGGNMTRVYKGSGAKSGKPKLVCTAWKAGVAVHAYWAASIEAIEQTISENMAYLVGTAPVGDEGLDAERERLEVLRDVISDHLANVAEAIAIGGDSPTLRAQLQALEKEREMRDKEYDALLDKIAAVSRRSVEKRLQTARELVVADGDRAEINAALRQALKAVVVDPKAGRLRFQWAHGGESELMFAWPQEDAEA